ncbi:MAG: RNA polymerase factor sigma-54 [Alphaproteobacteria bacterium]
MPRGPSLTQRLHLRQTQALVLTPQLQQAIKLLQLSNLELADYVAQELERNPLLEDDEGELHQPTLDGDGEAAETAAGPGLERDSTAITTDAGLPAEDEAPLDTDYENLWSSDAAGADSAAATAPFGSWRSGSRQADFDREPASLEQTLSQPKTLREHLLDQLNMDLLDPAERIIGVHLIDMIDEAGYLTADLASAAELLGCGLDRLEATLAKLQGFDPAGVFARSLKECLALELKDRNRLDPLMERLLDNLDLVARRDMAGLMKRCGVDAEDLGQMVAEIRCLSPKPGLAFDREVVQPIVPDVFVRQRPDGGWLIELNTETLPRVLVNERYYIEVVGAAKTTEERDYVTEQYSSANWLVKSLHQRGNTVLRVAGELVRRQDAFLIHGVQHLRPLVLRDVAEPLSMHESTVSRTITNKYMATPRGIYEMKYFFTSAVGSTTGGEVHSAEAVRHRIKELIENESADDVLSDDHIVDILGQDGVDIARRTVAKYRGTLKIPSSAQRRRLKKVLC